jgi:cell wall assembly regulator SMI1
MIIEDSNKYGEINRVLLERFEKEIGAKLPEQYREFLICHNGGKPVPSNFLISKRKGEDSIEQFYGLNNGPTYQRLNENYELSIDRLPSYVIPIGSDDFGNNICIGIKGKNKGKVYFSNYYIQGGILKKILFGRVKLISESFNEFLNSLYEWIDPEETEIERIFRTNDIDGLKSLLASGFDIETLDENDRTPIERAAVSAKNDIIKFLYEAGANLRSSLEIAQKNAEFFEKHKSTVELIKQLK